MSNPSYICRVAFTNNPFASTPTWADVSADLMSFHIRRGRQWELNRLEAGTATIRLLNTAGNYWPNNTTGSYYPNVLPWKRINLRSQLASETMILRPNAAGDEENLPFATSGAGNHWQDVDEAIPDEGGSVVNANKADATPSTYYRDLYNLPVSGGAGTITSVKVYVRCITGGVLDTLPMFISIKTNGTAYESANKPITTSYADYSNIWTTNPNTSAAWSWNEIDALQIGVKLQWNNSTFDSWGICTQVYAEITYVSTYDLYTGYIESWKPSFILKPVKAPIMDLVCSDGIKSLSKYLLNNTTGYAQEVSGTRIDNVLTALGWPAADRDINTGQSSLQSTGPLVNANAMTHIFTVEDTELGIFYESPSGAMVYQDRHARLKAPYTTSQATFGDTPSTGDLGYTGIDLTLEDLRIYNDIRVTPLSGTTTQVATSTTSQDTYGPCSLERPSLLMVSDAEALAQAQYLLTRYATPAMRCRQVEIRPNANPASLYPCVLGYDLSTRITVKLNQASINTDYHIEGIKHDWDVLDAAGIKTTWMLSDAETEQFWILEHAVFGVLDSTTRLAW